VLDELDAVAGTHAGELVGEASGEMVRRIMLLVLVVLLRVVQGGDRVLPRIIITV
jgi:hypothetical protein